MQRLSSRESMRAADAWAIAGGCAGSELMERAAAAVALQLYRQTEAEDEIVFLCGSGNNGGDGLAAARILAEHGREKIRIYLKGEPTALRGDAALNWKRLEEVHLRTEPIEAWCPEEGAWLVDALFGTGLNRPLAEEDQKLIDRMNASGKPIVAVDLPSGVNANTGQSWGAMIQATQTVTFARRKQGMLLEPARQHCGTVIVADIGLKEAPVLQEEQVFCLEPEDIASRLPQRCIESHKGTYGYLLALVGSEQMTGAAILSCRAAYRTGVGLVEALLPVGGALPLQCSLPEAVVSLYARGEEAKLTNRERATALLIGPGLGQEPEVPSRIRAALDGFPTERCVVLDADALNWISRSLVLKKLVQERAGATILTPHMKEASRLLACPVAELQQDRIGAALRIAKEYQAVVILKDAVTVIADPQGRVCINTTGNHGMATAGSGDVLAGLVAGLAAQSLQPFEAACLGAWLHGEAGDRAVRATGYYGLMASDIAQAIRLDR